MIGVRVAEHGRRRGAGIGARRQPANINVCLIAEDVGGMRFHRALVGVEATEGSVADWCQIFIGLDSLSDRFALLPLCFTVIRELHAARERGRRAERSSGCASRCAGERA